MKRIGFCALALLLACGVQANWIWPFGSSDDGRPRLSELMEQASLLIDEASDLATDGKVSEAVEKYRAALVELDRVERENPDRAATSEFASLRNKRAYVNAAIDSMLLSQVKSNAKVVAVSDTTGLEKKLSTEREKARKARRDQVVRAISGGDYAAAERAISEMLVEKPNGATPLNLRAMMEVRQGKFREAERTLDQAIMSNPRSYHAYYNMADLIIKMNPSGKIAAKRYYDTGRAMGGPVDEKLEAALK